MKCSCSLCLLLIMVLLQIIQTDSILQTNTWYNITISGLGQGSSNTQLYVNDATVSKTISPFDNVDFSVLNGPLYIGGHSSPQNIDVSIFSIIFSEAIVIKIIYQTRVMIVTYQCDVLIV